MFFERGIVQFLYLIQMLPRFFLYSLRRLNPDHA